MKTAKYCEENNIDGFLQTRQNAMLMNAKKEYSRFSTINFIWDEENQGYWCPEGHLLTYQGQTPKKKKDIYYTTECANCSCKEECTPKTKNRRIYDKFTEEQKRMMDKMSKKESEIIYSRRMGMVEHTFGHEKKNLNAAQMNHRGTEDIKTEKYLHAISYNVNRYKKLKNEARVKNKKIATDSTLQTTTITQPNNLIEKTPNYLTHCNESLLITNPSYQANQTIATIQ